MEKFQTTSLGKNTKKSVKRLLCGMLLFILVLSGCAKQDGAIVNGMDIGLADGDVDAVAAAEKGAAKIDEKIKEQFDKYAAYYEPAVYKDLLDSIVGNYSGAGVYIYQDEATGLVTVNGVMKNGPAFKAGMQPGDQILKINGQDMTKKTLEDVSAILKAYPVGTAVDILVQRPEAGEVTLKVTVDHVDIPTLEGTVLDGNIGLIKIASFNKTTGDQFAQELRDLQAKNIKGLIIDLRDNGGGEVTAALQICDYFIEKGKPLMYITDPSGTRYYQAATDPIQLPVVALQNGNSASASEILLGAIQDSGAGKTVGENSFGKGLMQEVYPLDSGAGLKVTSARYMTAGERDIHKVGIQPDVEFAMPEGTDIYASLTMDPKKDPQLAKAIDVLQQEIEAKQAKQ